METGVGAEKIKLGKGRGREEVPKTEQVRRMYKYRKVQVFEKNRRWTINP